MSRLVLPLKLQGRAMTVFGVIWSLLTSVSTGLILYFMIEMGIAASIGIPAVVFGAFIYYKPYKLAASVSPAGIVFGAVICLKWTVRMHIALVEEDPAYIITPAYYVMIFMFYLLILGTIGVLLMKIGRKENEKIDEKVNWKKNYPGVFMTTLAFFFTTVIFLPSDVYINNYKNFMFIYKHFIFSLLITASVYIILLPLIFCRFSKLVCRIYNAVMCGLTLSVYVQCTFMNRSLPLMMGEPVDWSKFTTEKIVTAVVWVVLLAAPVVLVLTLGKKVKKIGKGVVAVPMFIFGIEFLSLAVMLVTTTGIYDYHDYMLSNEQQFTVSKNKNVITFIIDNGDIKYFNKALEENPEKYEPLKDFTYYTNYCIKYDATALSVPQLLTESDIQPKQTLDKWYGEIWDTDRTKEFYDRLHKNDYTVNMFGNFASNYNALTDKADNVKKIEEEDIEINRRNIYRMMTQFGEYRLMPYLFKESFEVNTDEFFCAEPLNSCKFKNEEFRGSMDLKLSDGDKNYFILEHILGTHFPFTATKSLESETLYCLDLLADYIRQLKELGVYDDAAIIITADHGNHEEADFPIFMIKEPGRTADKISFSSKPIYVDDMHATWLTNAGLYDKSTDAGLFGKSIYDYSEDEKRERLWFARDGFAIIGDAGLTWEQRFSVGNKLFGYHFTGDEDEMKKVTSTIEPEIVIVLDDVC